MILDRIIVGLLASALALFPALASAQSPQVRQLLLTPTAPPPTVATTTAWNNSDKSGIVSLDGTRLIATITSGTGNVRSVASHSTGKYYWSQVVTGTNNQIIAGVADGAFALSSSAATTTDSAGITYTTGLVWFNNGVVGSGVAVNTSDVLDVAVDLGAKLLWYRVNGGAWKGSGSGTPDPVTGTQGAPFGSIGAGPYFALVGTQGTGITATVTTNFGASAYANAAPSGFGNW